MIPTSHQPNPLHSDAAHSEQLWAEQVRSLSEDQALTWFVALNRATVTDEQRMAFNRWLSLDPANRSSYRAVLALWERLEPTQATQ